MFKAFIARIIRRVARIFAEEVAREMERTSSAEPSIQAPTADQERVKLDVVDALAQLRSGSAKAELNEFFSMNHRWIAMLNERNLRTARDTYDFIESEMTDAIFMLNQFTVVQSKSDLIMELNGEVLDLGVYKGGSTRALARIFPDKTIHGFDSFEGLSGDWSYVLKGGFGDVQGSLPEVPGNVCLYKGWFDDTLPQWASEHTGHRISLLRIDCDIYSSTKTVFDELGHLISSGTWILFDELIGYPGWRQHEYKAFEEFLDSSSFGVEYVAYGLTYALIRLSEPTHLGGGRT